MFSSLGTKTLTATYVGDNLHLRSSATASHQVSTTTVVTPTRVATAVPPPELVVINEFVPRPGHDWNNDGIVNVEDEYVEILNHGVVNVNLSGYTLDDEVNIGSAPYTLPAVVLRPGERVVFYGSETGLLLSDGGDGVRLLRPNGQLIDAYNYFIVERPDQSYCRLPDNGGADDWNENCFTTPGLQNSLSGQGGEPPTGVSDDLYCPIADTLPQDFAQAECNPYGNDIWRAEYWDETGWYGEMNLPETNGKWPVFAD
ncbi:MAG TPA: lamin tail domain-containing protein [Anaerolineales bacterium]|nr:lamin tail domain-containing protein [Anaerolineales bacterium]